MNFPILPTIPSDEYYDHATLPHLPAPRNGEPWIMKIPVLSTCHLPQAVFESLPDLMGPAYMGEINESGSLVRIDDEDLAEYTDELGILVQYLASRNYQYVRLDANGDQIKDLPQYPW